MILPSLSVRQSADGPGGWLDFGARRVRCALGRGGIGVKSGEGDGVTPVGRWPLRRVLYRADRLAAPVTALPCQPLTPDDGWCDDPGHTAYNQPIIRPFAASHEQLWRADGLYDLIVVVGYNDAPVVVGKGSAIFVHVARPGYAPTQGCVALTRDDLLAVLTQMGPKTGLTITA